jgi:hypothetical protein
MLSPFRREEFKQLEREWYQKLKDVGFHDIEDTQGESRFLKSWHSTKCQEMKPVIIEQIKIYYKEGVQLLDDYPFDNPVHRRIWKLHTRGLSIRQIARKVKRLKKSMIHLIISKIAEQIR